MSTSPFAFYRGTAALMAADLADAPHSGILVASCGDAHVSNFGFYASAERRLMFDLNDFDEAAWAPWEWDVKRLVASIVVGGRASGRSDEVIDTAVLTAVSGYARGIARATELSPTARYFTHFDVASSRTMLDKASQKAIRRAVKQASQSVLVEYGRIPQPTALQEVIDADGEGARVVAMQRILQALSDPFLGHMRNTNADFYVRQFHDMKGSIDVEDLDDGPFITYGQACAATIARAHSQSLTATEVAGYIGNGRALGQALLEWARAYAAVSLADYETFRASL